MLKGYCAENNLAIQEDLYKLRRETQEAFNDAKALEGRWAELEKEQRDVYQVRDSIQLLSAASNTIAAFHAAISHDASPARNHCAG